MNNVIIYLNLQVLPELFRQLTGGKAKHEDGQFVKNNEL